jgi:hypothetical protein
MFQRVLYLGDNPVHAVAHVRRVLGDHVAVIRRSAERPVGVVFARYGQSEILSCAKQGGFSVVVSVGPDDLEDAVSLYLPIHKPEQFTMAQSVLLFVDCNTTGFDPLAEDARIWEIAVGWLHDGAPQLVGSVLHLEDVPTDRALLHRYKEAWPEVLASAVTEESIDGALEALASGLTGGIRHACQLSGYSPHFELAWVKARLPRFAAYCSHRVFDLGSVRTAFPGVIPWGAASVRSLDNVRSALVDAIALDSVKL